MFNETRDFTFESLLLLTDRRIVSPGMKRGIKMLKLRPDTTKIEVTFTYTDGVAWGGVLDIIDDIMDSIRQVPLTAANIDQGIDVTEDVKKCKSGKLRVYAIRATGAGKWKLVQTCTASNHNCTAEVKTDESEKQIHGRAISFMWL